MTPDRRAPAGSGDARGRHRAADRRDPRRHPPRTRTTDGRVKVDLVGSAGAAASYSGAHAAADHGHRDRVRHHLHLPRAAPARPGRGRALPVPARRQSWGRSSNVFLRNGSRLYLDVGSHPEYATAECDDLHTLIAHDKAGERILQDLVVDAEARLEEEGIGGDIYLFKNNTDSAGNSYGCHENFLIGPAGRVLQDRRRADPVPGHPAADRRRGEGAAVARAERPTACPSGPTTSGRGSRRRPPGPGRSSTPATNRTPTPNGTGGCT